MIPFSVLDLSPIVEGGDAAQSLANTLDLARAAERLGYRRYWLAEHHGIPGVASAATAVVIAHVAGGTSSIRVGAGGIMLPNHAPIIIAEQFGTLASLFPGRIDLGLGRAPGSDHTTMRALRRDPSAADTFPVDVRELLDLFRAPVHGQTVIAVPGAGLDVPVWILGSSLFGASLAAAMGLPFAFASHFAPQRMLDAIDIYRTRFQPSERLARPYMMLGVNIIAAESDAEARRLLTSLQQAFVNLRRGHPTPLQPPVDDIDSRITPLERAGLETMLAATFAGSATTVADALSRFIGLTGADELMIASQIHDHRARVRSYEIAAQVRDALDDSIARSNSDPIRQ